MTAAVPDPRFRDQLTEALAEHRTVATSAGHLQCSCDREWRLPVPHRKHLADNLAPLVEARVQAAAKQGAVEELEALVSWAVALQGPVLVGTASLIVEQARARAAALASPAPAPRAEEGQAAEMGPRWASCTCPDHMRDHR